MNIAIIPARKNSQRIKNKNIKKFFGKPIIYYSIKEAVKSKLFNKIVVTTDSKKIKNFALKNGVDIVIDRKKKLSKDGVGIVEVIKNSIEYLENLDLKIRYVCCIFPASPLIKHANIIKGHKKILSKKYDFIFVAKKINSKNQKIFVLKNDKIKKFENSNKTSINFATDAGQFYWGSKSSWMKNKTTFTKKTSFIALEDFKAQDINTHYDWNLSKILFKLK